MNPTDEDLLHTFYAGDSGALEQLIGRYSRLLRRLAYLILRKRTGSKVQALREWDIDQRTANVWTHILLTREAALGGWPHQRLSALTWFIHLLCLEMDRHLGFRAPF
jgi:hypothetical protein